MGTIKQTFRIKVISGKEYTQLAGLFGYIYSWKLPKMELLAMPVPRTNTYIILKTTNGEM
jgi:hypothetical protein